MAALVTDDFIIDTCNLLPGPVTAWRHLVSTHLDTIVSSVNTPN